jgi:hypothetical protein
MPTLRATRDGLQNRLPGLIIAYNAETENTIDLDLPDPARYFIPAEDPLGGGGGFPVVELFIGRGSIGVRDVHNQKADVDDRLTVCLWQERDRGELAELYEVIAGYGRVLLEALLQDGAFGVDVEVANDEDSVTYDYSIVPDDPENRDFQKWRTAVVISFRLEDVTDIP